MKTWNFIIVDDDPATRKKMRDEIRESFHGEGEWQASEVETIFEAWHGWRHVDFLLVDVSAVCPESCDPMMCFHPIAKFGQDYPHTKIVLVSGFSPMTLKDVADRVAEEIGRPCYIHSWWRNESLGETINAILSAPREAQPPTDKETT